MDFTGSVYDQKSKSTADRNVQFPSNFLAVSQAASLQVGLAEGGPTRDQMLQIEEAVRRMSMSKTALNAWLMGKTCKTHLSPDVWSC